VKITGIKPQVKKPDRYSIFVDEKYAFSLSEGALLASKLVSGQELDKSQLEKFKKESADDKLYNQALRYIALRPRTEWEIKTYLERKKAAPAFIEITIDKLRKIELINDEKFAQAFVADRRLLRPSSRRKLINELRKKRVADEIIQEAVGDEDQEEQTALIQIIAKKRQQIKYQDDQKLMQYLSRQGFSYDDIKHALKDY
jgi:regulatory protein